MTGVINQSSVDIVEVSCKIFACAFQTYWHREVNFCHKLTRSQRKSQMSNQLVHVGFDSQAIVSPKMAQKSNKTTITTHLTVNLIRWIAAEEISVKNGE
jgi:hypothetical protein